jgi:hypothetical protein
MPPQRNADFLAQSHRILGPSGLPAESALLAWWAYMQHFGCPALLLCGQRFSHPLKRGPHPREPMIRRHDRE